MNTNESIPNDQKPKSSNLIPGIIIILTIGLLMANVIPNFLRYPGRAKQDEAKHNLVAIFKAYQQYHSDHHTYPSAPEIQDGNTVYNCFTIAGWKPKDEWQRYNYYCMNTGVFSPDAYSPNHPCPPGVVSTATKDSFTVAACGNVDNDTTVDVWTINDRKQLRNIIDDVKL